MGRAGYLGRSQSMTVAGSSGGVLASARFTLNSGAQTVADNSTSGPILWPTVEWDDIGFPNDYLTTGEFFAPLGEYLIVIYIQLNADPGVQFPGGGDTHVELVTADAENEQQTVTPSATGDTIPKFSISGVHSLGPSNAAYIEAFMSNVGTAAVVYVGTITFTKLKAL